MAKHIYLIAGHGAGDSGACGGGYQEQERVRVLCQRMADLGGEYVHLHPFKDNAYASGAISKLSIPKDWLIVEEHMDSSDNKTAKGAHVIIKQGFSPDKYDEALAKALTKLFPGRATAIARRFDLGNANRAARRGYNYRLVENCFISNANDLAMFNANIDAIAKVQLEALGVPVNGEVVKTVVDATAKVEKAAATVSGNALIKQIQNWLNIGYGAGLVEDGYYGPKTKAALVKALQHELNAQYSKGLAEDGDFGPKTKRACVNVRKGAKGNITRILQSALICHGYSKGGFDGSFGSGTETAVKQFQAAKKLAKDGIAGPNTFEALLN